MTEEKNIKVSEVNNKINNDENVMLSINHDDSTSQERHSNSSHSHSHHSHHSQHHGHHIHHRRHRHSHRKMKFGKKLMIPVVCTAIVLALILAVVMDLHLYNNSLNNKITNSSNELTVELTKENGVLVANAVSKYLSVDMLAEYNKSVTVGDFLEKSEKFDSQVPIGLKLSIETANAVSYKIELSDNELFENSKIDYLSASSGTYSFNNLYSNTEYFYRVTAYTTSSVVSNTGSFKTADTPRILTIDGISNVRDIGNWKTDSGKRIKQGLLIRGTELDGAVENDYHLTNDGLVDMLGELGIKTDIDLRAQPALNKDALGSRVEHMYFNMVMYSDVFTDVGKERVKSVFDELANPNIYPAYIHCTYGRDRTGTVCYLLEALLGVSKGDCRKDYGLSNVKIDNIIMLEKGLEAYEGDNLKEQVESYLISCGVTQTRIEAIRNIFLED